KGAKTPPSAAEKQKWYAMLLWEAQDRGYRRGWAANNFREKFGVWPRGMRETSTPPDQHVRNFLTAQRIRFAKRREKAAKAAAPPVRNDASGNRLTAEGGIR